MADRMTIPFTAVALVVLAALLPSPALAQEKARGAAARSFEIRASGGLGGSVTRIGGFRIRRDPTIRAAERVFGRPSSKRLGRFGTCAVDWRRLRLSVRFENFGARSPGETTCSPTVGRAQSFSARGSRFRTWRGLRVGARSAAIPDLHPNADFRRGRWWLTFAESPFGDGGAYPSLYATVVRGRVSALKGWIGAAGE